MKNRDLAQSTGKQYWTSLGLLLLATFLWGSTFSCTKILVSELPPFSLVAIRFFLTSVLLLLFFYRKIMSEIRNAFSDRLIWWFSLLNLGAITSQTVGLGYTTASNAGFITALSLIIVPFIERYNFKRHINGIYYFAAFLSLIGFYLIFFGVNLSFAFNVGDNLVLLCALFYGYYIVLLERLVQRFSGPTIMFCSFLLTALISLLVGLIFEPLLAIDYNIFYHPRMLFSMAYLVSFGGFVSYLLMARGQKDVPSYLSSLIYVLEPVFASIVAFIYLGERMKMIQLTGGLIICLALVVGIFARKDVVEDKIPER